MYLPCAHYSSLSFSQMAGHRAINAERALEVVSKHLDSVARHNMTLHITLELLANMMRRMFLNNSFQKSVEISSLVDMLVVSVGFDKSNWDFVGTWWPCNRRNRNSTLFVQTFACLEGPVSEDYANEVQTIGKPNYPIKDTI